MKKTSQKTQRGITLIALVITIVVLLILAGISIAMLTGENGILTKAEESKNQTEEAQAIEEVKLAIMCSFTEEGIFDAEQFKKEIEKQGKSYEEDESSITVGIGEIKAVVDKKTGEIKELKKAQDIITVTSQVTPDNEFKAPQKEITLVANNEKYGIKSIQLPDPDGTIVESNTATYTVTQNGKYTFVVLDNVGKEHTETVEITNIVDSICLIGENGKDLRPFEFGALGNGRCSASLETYSPYYVSLVAGSLNYVRR